VQPRTKEGVKTYTYGREQGDFHAENIRIGSGRILFDYVSPWQRIADVELGVPMSINIENGIASMAIAQISGATAEEIRTAMGTFNGVERRFDFRIKEDNIVMLSDYAHHPDEIKACALSMKELYSDKKITAMFQPHLFSRTKDFYREFAAALSLFDEVILLDIYPAREQPIPGVTSNLIYDNIDAGVQKSQCKRSDAVEYIRERKEEFEVLICLGAGDLESDTPQIAEILKQRDTKH
jgi:UDP-N-acetylmuramate--alanine ligase